jgi:hypothetical protein
VILLGIASFVGVAYLESGVSSRAEVEATVASIVTTVQDPSAATMAKLEAQVEAHPWLLGPHTSIAMTNRVVSPERGARRCGRGAAVWTTSQLAAFLGS